MAMAFSSGDGSSLFYFQNVFMICDDVDIASNNPLLWFLMYMYHIMPCIVP